MQRAHSIIFQGTRWTFCWRCWIWCQLWTKGNVSGWNFKRCIYCKLIYKISHQCTVIFNKQPQETHTTVTAESYWKIELFKLEKTNGKPSFIFHITFRVKYFIFTRCLLTLIFFMHKQLWFCLQGHIQKIQKGGWGGWKQFWREYNLAPYPQHMHILGVTA